MARKKSQLRRELRKVLRSLDERWIKAASGEICDRLNHLIDDSLGAKVEHVLAWTPFFPGEIDLSKLIAEQLGRRALYLPRTELGGTMSFIRIDEGWLSKLEPGQFGILEPTLGSGPLFQPEFAASTAILLPGLAFDSEGNRLGRGEGFYDRFLGKSGMGDAIKIGVCWRLQYLDQVPVDSHDILVDWVCHEEGIVQTGFISAEEDL